MKVYKKGGQGQFFKCGYCVRSSLCWSGLLGYKKNRKMMLLRATMCLCNTTCYNSSRNTTRPKFICCRSSAKIVVPLSSISITGLLPERIQWLTAWRNKGSGTITRSTITQICWVSVFVFLMKQKSYIIQGHIYKKKKNRNHAQVQILTLKQQLFKITTNTFFPW